MLLHPRRQIFTIYFLSKRNYNTKSPPRPCNLSSCYDTLISLLCSYCHSLHPSLSLRESSKLSAIAWSQLLDAPVCEHSFTFLNVSFHSNILFLAARRDSNIFKYVIKPRSCKEKSWHFAFVLFSLSITIVKHLLSNS